MMTAVTVPLRLTTATPTEVRFKGGKGFDVDRVRMSFDAWAQLGRPTLIRVEVRPLPDDPPEP